MSMLETYIKAIDAPSFEEWEGDVGQSSLPCNCDLCQLDEIVRGLHASSKPGVDPLVLNSEELRLLRLIIHAMRMTFASIEKMRLEMDFGEMPSPSNGKGGN